MSADRENPTLAMFTSKHPLERLILHDRIAAGWEPSAGPWWHVVSTVTGRPVHHAPIVAPSACAAVTRIIESGLEIREPLIALLHCVVTEEDVTEWRRVRDEWIARRQEQR